MGKMKGPGPAMCAPSEEESCSISVSKISNGYLVRESRCSNGNYTSSERFSPTKPDLDMDRPSGPNVGRENLSGAMKELKR